MDSLSIGWPEGIMLALMFANLLISASNHGKAREPFDFPVSLVSFFIMMTLLAFGGFFS